MKSNSGSAPFPLISVFHPCSALGFGPHELAPLAYRDWIPIGSTAVKLIETLPKPGPVPPHLPGGKLRARPPSSPACRPGAIAEKPKIRGRSWWWKCGEASAIGPRGGRPLGELPLFSPGSSCRWPRASTPSRRLPGWAARSIYPDPRAFLPRTRQSSPAGSEKLYIVHHWLLNPYPNPPTPEINVLHPCSALALAARRRPLGWISARPPSS